MKDRFFVGFKIGNVTNYAEFHGNYVKDINKAHLYGEAYSKVLANKFTEELKYCDPSQKVFRIKVPVVV